MTRFVFFAGLSAFLFFGPVACFKHRIIPAPAYLMEAGPLPVIRMSGPISLSDRSPDNSELEVCSRGIHVYYARAADLMRGALIVLTDIFVQNKIDIVDQADKRIDIAVVDATCEPGFFCFDIVIRIRVHTGEGYEKDFFGIESTADLTGTLWAVEKALTAAVLAIFKDVEILRYLQQEPIWRPSIN